jgi:hypothetical protein
LEEEIVMSQRNRIALAALALMAALALVTPPPVHAAGLQTWKIPAIDALDRAWAWLAHLLPGESHRTVAMQEKEGGSINPNGGTTSGFTVPTPSTSSSGADGTK